MRIAGRSVTPAIAMLISTLVLGCSSGDETARQMTLPLPYTVDGQPILGTYGASTLRQLAMVKDVGMNVVIGGEELLDIETPEGKYCHENGIKVMLHLTSPVYRSPRLGAPLGTDETTIPVSGVRNQTPESGTILIEDELIRYGGRTHTSLLNCQRGFDGTTPAPHHEGQFLFYPEKCAEKVTEVKDSPNLWGYYVLDDSPGDALSALRGLYSTIKRVDESNRPVCAGYGSAGSLCNFGAGVCDIMMIYWYPVGGADEYARTMTPLQVQWMVATARARVPGMPFVGVYQTFDGNQDSTGIPTPAQLREQVGDFVREGASGLISFLCADLNSIRGWEAHDNLPPVLKSIHNEIIATGALTIPPEPDSLRAARVQPIGHYEIPRDNSGLVPAWYVIGPFHAGEQGGIATVFPPESDPSNIDISVRHQAANGPASWIKRRATGGSVGMGEIFGQRVPNTIAYATCTVNSATEQTVRMMLGSDDDAIVWLNGEEVWRYEGGRGLDRDSDMIEIVLPAGESRILMKNCNRVGMSGIFMRFADTNGEPLEGLSFSPTAM
jgi:hypothetical protein